MNRALSQLKHIKVNAFYVKVAAIFLLFMPMATQAFASTELVTVQHVYIDDTYVGKVSNQEIVDQTIDKVIQQNQETYKGYELEIGNDITYISEQVFRPIANDEEVSKKVEEMAVIKAVSTAITANDKTIAYLKNETDAEAVLKKVKLQYVSEEELSALDEAKTGNTSLPALKKDESRVTNVSIQETVNLADEATDLQAVLTVDDAVEMLNKGTLEDKKHIVKEGEAFEIIADQYGLSVKQLKELNEGITEESILQIGQEINTVVTKPLLHVIVEREVHKEETVPFEKEVIENKSMPKGETKVKQEGKNGKSAITFKVTEANGKQVDQVTINENVLEAPIKEIVEKGTKVIPSRGSGTLAWPASGGYVSSKMGTRWGRVHKGIDIARPSNRTIKAADHGVIVSAGWDGSGYGNKIVIDHQNGFRTVYAHLDSISVSAGQKVEKGSKIGVMGSTGNSTGVHLHFEVYKNGNRENPLSHL